MDLEVLNAYADLRVENTYLQIKIEKLEKDSTLIVEQTKKNLLKQLTEMFNIYPGGSIFIKENSKQDLIDLLEGGQDESNYN